MTSEEAPAGPPLFEDITSASGISFTYRNGEDTANHLSILESLGGGVGLLDYDGDGLLDVFLPGGGIFEGADQKTIAGCPCKLYRNLGRCQFQDVTAAAGLEQLAGGQPWFYSHGAAFADLDGDGYPDLYVCQYVDWSWKKHPACHYDGKTPDVCPPRNFNGLVHKLYRNNGRGGFIDVSTDAGLRPGGPTQSKGLGVLIVDVDGDGKPDVYVANDTVDNFLYWNSSDRGTIRLEERGLASGVALDDYGNANGSMGVDAGDPWRSGKPALWVTNYENELHALYRNQSEPGRPFFNFRSTAMGIGAIGQKFVGWGTAFLDADLDGWEDLFVANGHAIRFPTGKSASRRQRPVLLINESGKKFRDASNQIGSYTASPRLARGVAFGDLDNDGRTDLVVSHINEPVAVLRGIGGEGNHWIGVRLEGKDHACTVGARAIWEANGQRQTRFVKGGGSYASSSDRRLLFGLGSETTGRLIVTWPDRTEQTFDNLEIDHYYHIVQGSNEPKVETGQAK